MTNPPSVRRGRFEIYNLGYPIGGKLAEEGSGKETDSYVLNNHLRFKIKYHPVDNTDVTGMSEEDGDGSYIVGFTVVPLSIKHTYYGKWNQTAVPYAKLSTCTQPPTGHFEKHLPQVIDPAEGGEVIFTYDVVWEQSDIKWASRWDVYLQMTDDNIHWFSIVNSLVILTFLTGIVGLIMTRILRKDFARYNEVALSEEERAEQNREMREETGWKLVYGDVFRAPAMPRVLAVHVGTGLQLTVMAVLTLIFATLGFLSPSNRGALLSSVLVFFVLMGLPAGYTAARLAKLLKDENPYRTAMLTGTLFPGVCFAVFFWVNIVAWSKQSSSAVPFGTLVVLCLLWFCVSLPLIFFGAFLGYKKEAVAVPVQTNPIPRQIPEQLWYLTSPAAFVIGGLLSFGAVFVEMFFIISSIWQHRFYYMFGFLALVFLILVVTCAEITIVLAYLHLCSEEYRWWWRSFITSGSVAVYMFMYGGYHYFARAHPHVHFDTLSTSIYFGYMFIFSYAAFTLTGFIGFAATFAFIKKIYGSIKID